MEKYNYLEAVTADAKEAIMYKKYVWYKVWYKFTSSYNNKTYDSFEFAINTEQSPDYINQLINKYGNDFIKVEEWVI